MFFCIYMTLLTLLTINQNSTTIEFTEKSKISLKMIAYSLPIMLVLFILFPRISAPLWKTDSNQSLAQSGLTDSMEPGQISQMIYSNKLVFRAAFKNTTPAQNQLYWRAITLWDFNGKKWSRHNITEPIARINILDRGFEYNITLQPNNKKWLFLLDLPYQIDNGFSINTDFTARSENPVNTLLQYNAHSSAKYFISSKLSEPVKAAALHLPAINSRTAKLALSWKQSVKRPEEIIKKAIEYFSKQNFYYTLSPPLLNQPASVDQFLFETRQGFCEHYASAFSVLMRAAGIPSRIVLGYQGGDLNPYNNIISVDQSMAHAWTEVWLENKGWVRIDPTAAIAPDRVDKNIAAALKDQTGLPLHLQLDFAFLLKIKQMLSAIDNKWNQWILNYNKASQQKFLEFLTGKHLNLKQIALLFIQVLLAVLTITALVYFLNNLKRKHDPVTEAYKKFQSKLATAGFKKGLNEGPKDFEKRLVSKLPAEKEKIRKIINLYVDLKFRNNKKADNVGQFIQSVKKFRLR